MDTIYYYASCDCFDQYTTQQEWSELKFHKERQDTECYAWKHLLDLIEEAAADGREEFAPGVDMTWEEWTQIVTLPPTISKLKMVKKFVLYGSFLIHIPPEIGKMTNLEFFDPYTSYRLHWFPYEITRCKHLWANRVSTRALYGNYKYRPPFPKLQPGRSSTKGLDLNNLPQEIWGTKSIKTCSVCDRPLKDAGLYQVWLSSFPCKKPLRIETIDVLPLLVNACGGGGGRVALYYGSRPYTGTVTAYGGTGYRIGGAGTVYEKARTAELGNLRIDNEGVGLAETPILSDTLPGQRLAYLETNQAIVRIEPIGLRVLRARLIGNKMSD